MKILQASELFFKDIFWDSMQKNFPHVLEKASIGLAGEGSECYGYEDSLSADHDFGVGFCIWLNERDYEEWKNPLKKFLLQSPLKFMGYPNKFHNPNLWDKRVGIFSAQAFYKQFLGIRTMPQTYDEWLSVPQKSFSVCTNGKLFLKQQTEFTAMRQKILEYYPEDVRLKKMAEACFSIAQAGQYNTPRAIKRNDLGAISLCLAEFSIAVISLLFLINKQYMPFYKWAYRALKDLPVLGEESCYLLLAINKEAMSEQKSFVLQYMEELCGSIRRVLNSQNLTETQDNWFMTQALELNAKIKDGKLKNMPLKSTAAV